MRWKMAAALASGGMFSFTSWKNSQWHELPKQFFTSATSPAGSIKTMEAGGNGDCLFHSIKLGFDLSGEYCNNELTVQSLRKQVADELGKDMAEFERILDCWAAVEKSGEWCNQWSPKKIKSGHPYRTTSGALFTTKSMEEKYAAVSAELSICGGTHWGGDVDLGMLERSLDCGFIIFTKSNGKIYNYGMRTDVKHSKYLLLYYHDDAHYQLAGIPEQFTKNANVSSQSKFNKNSKVYSVFPPEKIPDFLLKKIEKDIRQPLFPNNSLQSKL
eukprot:GHVL01000524.1.p1 GENE.GHVL01000524.1~~GHVL01000524.1.p1  ORF type:complete len:272 (-),score=42.09 GHVL01000524.1:360-1175(-)